MNKPTSKKLTFWFVTAVFLAFVMGFSLLDQPTAKAQGFPGVMLINRAEPFRHGTTGKGIPAPMLPISNPENQDSLQVQEEQDQSLTPLVPVQSTTAPVISPTASSIESVAVNVRRLLDTKECVGCNLSGANLKTVNLQAANLAGANLQDADLEKANLQETNLQAANLQGADLGKANIAGANLQGANLFDADLEKANLIGAKIEGANLQGADLEKATMPTGITLTD
ncbi:MAG: pentapeptide repeat-containing protein [Chroococcidiopsidaceae cyanobacterium CP_BM_RX_35]|nr:pentapeptide repeat-containing protein [Chroococcidiopsidaceae cyanobacterium CP_BM_RX_35]